MVHVFLITSYYINNMHSVRPICLCKENLWSIKWPSASESTSSMISAQCVIEAFPRPPHTSAQQPVPTMLLFTLVWLLTNSDMPLNPNQLTCLTLQASICIVCQTSLECCSYPPAGMINYIFHSIQILWFLWNPKQTAYNKPRHLVPAHPLRKSLFSEGQRAKHCVLLEL